MTITRQMLGKAHDVLLKRGLMLSGELIEEMYDAMSAPPSEITDERILEIAKEVNLNNEAMGFIWNQDIPVRYIQQFCVAFARAVLAEGRK